MYKASLHGTALTVGGEQPKVGDKAPDFTASKNDLSPETFSKIPGVKIISAVPSLDTGVCSTQTARFYNEVKKLNGVTVITISMDLPFAQARWCQAEKAEGNSNFILLSDYKNREFARQYGLTINELALIGRAIIVVDAAGIVRYTQYPTEIGTEPDYAPALEAAQKL